MKRILATLVLAAATALCGCKSPKQPVAPVTPPLPVQKMKSMLLNRRTNNTANVYIPAAHVPAVPVPNTIYIQKTNASTPAIISWLNTDTNRSFYLYTTDIRTPVEMWELPGHWGTLRSTNDSMISVAFTNQVPMAFFRLVSVDTNTLGVGWTYDVAGSPEVDSYVLRYGNTISDFPYTNIIEGRRLWSTVTVPDINTNWFFTLTTRISTNGVESAVSTIAIWPPLP